MLQRWFWLQVENGPERGGRPRGLRKAGTWEWRGGGGRKCVNWSEGVSGQQISTSRKKKATQIILGECDRSYTCTWKGKQWVNEKNSQPHPYPPLSTLLADLLFGICLHICKQDYIITACFFHFRHDLLICFYKDTAFFLTINLTWSTNRYPHHPHHPHFIAVLEIYTHTFT